MAAPQRREQRAAHFGLDFSLGVMLERLGPNGPADVIDQHVDAPETGRGGGHHPRALAVLFQVGGQQQRSLMLQFMHKLGAIHRDQPGALLQQALGDTPADPLGSAGDQRDLVVKPLSHAAVLRRHRTGRRR